MPTKHAYEPRWYAASEVDMFDINRYHFEWDDNYTMFRPILLRWNDNLTYISHQTEDNQ